MASKKKDTQAPAPAGKKAWYQIEIPAGYEVISSYVRVSCRRPDGSFIDAALKIERIENG